MKAKLILEDPCQEDTGMSVVMKIDCGHPAVKIIWHNKDQRAYRMCAGCASHNLANRGGIELVQKKEGREA